MATKATTHMILMLCPTNESSVKAIVGRFMEQRPGADLPKVKGRLGELEERLGKVEKCLGELEGRLINVEGRLSNVEKDVSTLLELTQHIATKSDLDKALYKGLGAIATLLFLAMGAFKLFF